MKKLLIFTAIFCTAQYISAQLYFGGSFGLNIHSEHSASRSSDTRVDFSVFPEIGASLKNKWDFGLAFGVGKFYIPNNYDDREVMLAILSPYARSPLVQLGGFKLQMQYSFAIAAAYGYVIYGLYLNPVISYKISKHFALLGDLNFLNAGFTFGYIDKGYYTMDYGFGVNNLLNNNIKVGVAYVF